MNLRDWEFRLSGVRAPDGEIGLAELATLSSALQELATRIGRGAVDQRGPGRTPATVEALTRMRLTGLSSGSTRLHLAYGQADVLPIEADLERDTAERFIEIIEGLSKGERPGWANDLVAESAVSVLEAFDKSASNVEFRAGNGGVARIEPSTAPRRPWEPVASGVSRMASATGRLEAVDLRSARFRIRDDVGNAVNLDRVPDPEGIAPLINKRVFATGEATHGPQGELRSIERPKIEAAPIPEEWKPGAVADWQQELEKPGPDPEGGADISDEEFARFLDAIHS